MSDILFKDVYFKDVYGEEHYKYIIERERKINCLTEQDFYPPEDNRVLKSYVQDIYGGDNFSDYCRYIFSVLDEEEYYD